MTSNALSSKVINLLLLALSSLIAFVPPAIAATIDSKALQVTVSSQFPQVEQYLYKSSNAIIFGQQDQLNTVIINGKEYQPEVKFKKTNSRAQYILTFPEINVRIDAQLAVKDNILSFNVTKIQENGDTLVKTIDFPNHSLISVSSAQPNAQLTANSIVGSDIYMPLATASPTRGNASYLILNTDKLAAAIHNNTLDEWQRYKYRITEKDGSKNAAVASNLWIYREIDTEATELPFVKIIITADENADGIVDWQDGAIANRTIVENRLGHDLIPNTFSHIAIDFASVTQWPFLRILDNVKKLSLYTDGFGQMLLIKGYESEGHDSAHPDYGNNFNKKAGGVKDFEFLCKTAKKYNTSIGVHINHTEAYPEAKSYTNELVTENKGWRWLDQSWKIDRKADIVAGNLYQRLGELKKNAPSLAFVYVDVYSGKNWVEWKLGEKLNDFGWPVWTEFHPHLDNYYIWTHQPAGSSKIGRFIMNHQKDTYRFNNLLKGYYHRGFMGWDDGGYEKDITRVIETFMTKNLPTKYMQNHDLLKWDDEQATFSDNLVSKIEDSQTNIYKDGNLIVEGNKIFIPWHPTKETKIYHWNPEGGQSTWNLPKSWNSLTKVVLYQLTDLGRVFIEELSVNDGKVTVTADARIPYVLYKSRVSNKKVEWSENSLVKDTGFDSHSFNNWKPSSPTGDIDQIKIANDDKGRTHLVISGNAGQAAAVSQTINGLKSGQTYAASVWLQLKGKRSAGIQISGLGKNDTHRMIDKTDFICNFPNSDKNGTYYQRVKVLFDVPKWKSKATLSLIATGGEADSVAMFDDVRVVKTTRTEQGDHLYFEDFENLDEGWGPFAYGYNGPCNTHISELHEGYTDDTIAGRYSMKTMNEGHAGHVLRTLPSVIEFKPSTEYSITFDYLTDTDDMYKLVIDKPFDKSKVDSRIFEATYKARIANDSISNFKDMIGKSDKSVDNNAIKVKSHGDVYIVNEDSPVVSDGEYTFTITASDAGRCGGVIRYASKDQFGFIGYDTGSKWVWSAGPTWGTLSNAGPNIIADKKPHTVKVRYVGTYYRVWVDGNQIFEGSIAAIPTAPGKTGFRNWFNSTATYSGITTSYSKIPLSPDDLADTSPLVTSNLTKPGGTYTATFKTTNVKDTFVAFEKLKTGMGKLVIDNFTIDESKK